MTESNKYQPPTPAAGDKAYSLARAAVGSIPLVGNAAVELLSAVFAPPLERRRLQWMEEIANSLRFLDESRLINLGDLQSNEPFVTTLVQASEVAIRNHQAEKIEALRNAVVNSAVGVDIKEDLQLTFIRYINELTPSHFKLLSFFRDKEKTFERVDSYEKLFDSFASDSSTVSIQRDEFKLLCVDLTARLLLRISPDVEDFKDIGFNDVIWQEQGTDKPRLRVTDIGKQLLDFVKGNEQRPVDRTKSSKS